jgi:catechol 2,3-dioxygenase-like lactoylglutathione lyase family enzyme
MTSVATSGVSDRLALSALWPAILPDLSRDGAASVQNERDRKGGSVRSIMLFAAGLLVGLAVHVGLAQNAGSGVVMMNHVGINVPNIAEAVTYYTQKMGYREAFRVNDDKGQVRLVYMQISKNTFLELNPANAQRPAGFTHYGLHVENAADAVARFRKNGVTVSDTNTSDTKAVLANITDPYMGRIELAEITPESLHNKAIQSWK